MCVPILLVGNDARSNLGAARPLDEVVKCRTAPSTDRRAVEYHRDWLCRIRAMGCNGCFGAVRARTVSSCCACTGCPDNCASRALETLCKASFRLLACLATRLCQCHTLGMGGMMPGLHAQYTGVESCRCWLIRRRSKATSKLWRVRGSGGKTRRSQSRADADAWRGLLPKMADR
jgi:hypothetical protein